MRWTLGIARRSITPRHKVELAGCGYYLERYWDTVRDGLSATAAVIGDNAGRNVALLALDLMYNGAALTRHVRALASAALPDLLPEAICVNCSHTHSAPTAGWLRGAGEPDAVYLAEVAGQGAAAIMDAFHARQPVWLKAGSTRLEGMTFNRTRSGGAVDTRVGVLYAEAPDGHPVALILNFHAHPVLYTEPAFLAVSRDFPGAVVDLAERALPGALCMYLQGACGDVEFLREYREPGRQEVPSRALAQAALSAAARARPVEAPRVSAATKYVTLPTRRWSRQEVETFAAEGQYRLATGDTRGWLTGIAARMVNQPARLPMRYGGSVERAVAAVSRFTVEWADEVGRDLDNAPLGLNTEVQVLRIGDLYLAANAAELFSSFDLDLRQRWPHDDLLVLGYSNGAIGYLPDAYEIEQGGYAAVQSPKGMRQLPFTSESGPALVQSMLTTLKESSG